MPLHSHKRRPAGCPKTPELGVRIQSEWVSGNRGIAIEAINNLIKRINRVGFGFRNFQNCRIRALLYAGKPNWRVLGSIVVR